MPTYSQESSDGMWNNAMQGKIRREKLRGVFKKDSSFLMPKINMAWLLYWHGGKEEDQIT